VSTFEAALERSSTVTGARTAGSCRRAGWGRSLLASRHFKRRYAERWAMHRAAALASESMAELIAGMRRELAGAAARNFEKWPIIGVYVNANRKRYSETFDEEIDKLGSWLEERSAWIDAHIEEL
jgi:hypothetical protein